MEKHSFMLTLDIFQLINIKMIRIHGYWLKSEFTIMNNIFQNVEKKRICKFQSTNSKETFFHE